MDRQDTGYQEKIIPCNRDYPYAFISYSSKDGERVWKDVVELQDMGYNIWIDKNLKPTESSWKEAFNAIDSLNCKVVLFYISRNSVVSEPCRQELLRMTGDKAKHLHNGEIPLVVIEAEPIPSIESFRNDTYHNVSKNTGLSLKEREEKLEVLGKVMDQFFPNNDKIRIKGEQNDRKGNYYQAIVSCLDKVKCFDNNEQFVNLIEMLKYPGKYPTLQPYLLWAGKKNDPKFSLLLAFLYQEGIVAEKNKKKSEQFLMLGDWMSDKNNWKEEAEMGRKNQDLERALVYYLGIAMRDHNWEGYMYAGKIFLNLDNSYLAAVCLEKVTDKNKDCLKAYKALKHLQKGE